MERTNTETKLVGLYHNDPVVELLQKNADLFEVNSVKEIGQIVSKSGKAIVIYTSFLDFLRFSLSNQKQLKEAIKEWTTGTNELIQEFKLRRGQFILISSYDIKKHPQEFAKLSGIELGDYSVQEPSFLYTFVAQFVVNTFSEASKLVDYLDAISTPLSVANEQRRITIETIQQFIDEQIQAKLNHSEEINTLNGLLKEKATQLLLAVKENQLTEIQIENLDNLLTDVNMKLVNEELLSRQLNELLCVAERKAKDASLALDGAEFDKRRFRRQRDSVQSNKDKITEELNVVKNALVSKSRLVDETKKEFDTAKERWIKENDTLKQLLNQNKKDEIAANKVFARERQKLEALVEQYQKQNNQIYTELTLLQKECESTRSGKLWATQQAVKRAKNKLGLRTPAQVNQQDVSVIAKSEYFDTKWYLKTYPDVAQSGIHPIEHYLLYGFKEGRIPSPYFDGNWYLNRYPDVVDSGINPLLHYVVYGIKEGRVASPKMLQLK